MNNTAPLHYRDVATHLGRLAVYDSGMPSHPTSSTQVLVFWHAILADHHIYDSQTAALRDRHRLILIDGPAHGASGAPACTFSMAQCAQAQEKVLDALGIAGPVVCIGTSWGGLVAGEFALRYPQRTRAVAMFSPPVFVSKARLRDGFVAWGARWLSGTSVYVQGVAEGYFMPETREREINVMARFRQHIHDMGGKALALVVRSVLLDRADLAARLHHITVPALFIAGTYDTMCAIDDQRRAAAQLPHGRFVELPTAHIAVVDAPVETTQALEDLLTAL